MGVTQGRPDHRREGRQWQEGGPVERLPAPSAAPSPGDGIRVTVYNGTTVMGLAAQAARTLEGDGFTVTGTATASTHDQATTLIQYGPGEKARAGTLAQRFPGARLEKTSTTGIRAILGQDYADHPSADATASPEPTAVPSEVSDDARSADDNLCSNLSYG